MVLKTKEEIKLNVGVLNMGTVAPNLANFKRDERKESFEFNAVVSNETKRALFAPNATWKRSKKGKS